MTTTLATHAGTTPTERIDIEIVIPVHNEQRVLAESVRRLHSYLRRTMPYTWVVTIADNASTDHTWELAAALSAELDRVRAVRLEEKGRGRALRAVWGASAAAVVAYMDVDLSTELNALLPLVAPLLSGHSDLAIGTRLAPGARVVRGTKREVISRCYNLGLRIVLRNRFSDAQCGFKAVRTDVARRLLPLVEDGGWFFDTELLVLAEHNGLRIHEVPVDWVDDPDSRVDITRTAAADLRGVARMLASFARGRGRLNSDSALLEPGPDAGLMTGQVVHFAAIGAASTAAFATLYVLLFGALGAAGADVVSLALCAVGNLAANRQVTFPRPRRPPHRQSLLAMAFSMAPLAVAVPVLAALQVTGSSSLPVDLAVAGGLNLTSSLARFDLLRGRRLVLTDNERADGGDALVLRRR